MPLPLLLIVAGPDSERRRLEHDLGHRFRADCDIRAEPTVEDALRLVDDLAAGGHQIAVVFAPVDDGDGRVAELFARVHDIDAAVKRVFVTTYRDLSTNPRLNEAMALGLADDWLMTPWDPPDVGLYPTVTGLLADWTRERSGPGFEAIRLIGEQWDPRSHRLRDYLERNGLPFGFYARDSEEGRSLLHEAGLEGASRLPVAVLFDGRVLEDPSEADLAAAFGVRTRPDPGTYDVAVVGAGPAGLSAAVYAASEGLRTLHLESDALGGQAGTTSLIRNYLGFPRGISGRRLALSASQQSVFFGAIFVYAEAKGLRGRDGEWVLDLGESGDAVARTVIVATGAAYRRLGVPVLEKMIGRGVFYGATVTEAKAVTGRSVFVVGAGNSAGQAAIHLAGYAERVTLVVRGGSLERSMSDYLIRTLTALGNVDVRLQTRVVDGEGTARLAGLTLVGEDGALEKVAADALFVLIGAEPRTDWLPGELARDERGYLLSGRDLATAQADRDDSPQRPPLLAETSLPGVFAAGDVRHGSMKRVAAAVGEGSTAIRLVHDYLAELSSSRAAAD